MSEAGPETSTAVETGSTPDSPPSVRSLDDDGRSLDEVTALAQRIGRHPLSVRLLLSRGVEPGRAMDVAFAPRLNRLRPPHEMAGFADALELLVHARNEGLRVGVFGDYAVDGVTTTTILTTYLEALGLEVVAKVAHRDRGYGIGVDEAAALVESGAQMIVTGDLGTSDVEALQWLRDHGIKTIVIDHHQVPEVAPPADAFINPHQAGCGFPFKGLCSAGVAFYLCAGLRTRLAKAGVGDLPDPRGLLDLVSLATVCDMMPLEAENRVLVAAGLRHLGQRGRPGLAALLRKSGVDGAEVLDEGHLGFKLGPRINAPGRLGTADPSLSLLRARTDAEAEPLADRVEMLNAQRKRQTERIAAEASAALLADPKLDARAGLMVADAGWMPGVVGIAANGLVEQFGRPVAILGIDDSAGLARGSVRSCDGVDVRAALAQCADRLVRFGGHREAAGLTVTVEQLPGLVDAFDAAIAEQRASVPARVDEEVVDCELRLAALTTDLCDAIRAAGPFGVGFARPRFIARGCLVQRTRVLKERHLAMTLGQSDGKADAIAFGMASQEPARGSSIDVVFVPQLDHFRGEARVKMHVERFWPSVLTAEN